MIALLVRLFVPDYKNYSNQKVRSRYGSLCSIVGIVLNIFMFIGKYLAGVLTASIAITADAFNNLSDAGSSLITLLGFKLASKKPDPGHPFGHGRFEYISGFVVSLIILVLGFELGKSAIEKIIAPASAEWSLISMIILCVSILVKGYMAFYNTRIGKKIDSAAMRATAADSLSDAVSTLIVLMCNLFSHWFGWQIDGWCGLAVALFVFCNGINAAKDTLGPMLGETASPELCEQITSIVLSSKEVCGIHDLIVHDYGPGRKFISLHAEVPCDHNIMDIHDEIDNLEVRLYHETGCLATIHMDPVENNNPVVNELKEKMKEVLASICPESSFHDFRIVSGATHTNLIFDCILPFDSKISEAELKSRVCDAVKQQIGPQYFCVIQIDRPFV